MAKGKTLQELKDSAIEALDGLKDAGEFTLSLDTGKKTIKITTQNVFENICVKYPFNDDHKLIVNTANEEEEKQMDALASMMAI